MAVVEGSSAGAEDARRRDGTVGGEPLPDEAVAQMLTAVSDRASVQGGREIDVRELLLDGRPMPASREYQEDLEREVGVSVADMIDAVRRSAERHGYEGAAKLRANVVYVDQDDELPGGNEHRGWASGPDAWVRALHGPWPTARLTLHELAHVLTREWEHGEGFRSVYLDAVEDAFGADQRELAEQRLEWQGHTEGE